MTKLRTIRREVHVALFDPDSNEQYFYPASILHSGLLAASEASAGGISFSPRRYAFRRGRQFPSLEAEGQVDQTILDPAARKCLFRGRAPRVKRPVVVTEDAGHLQTLAEGTHLDEHPLVAMKVLRKRASGDVATG